MGDAEEHEQRTRQPQKWEVLEAQGLSQKIRKNAPIAAEHEKELTKS